MPSPAGGINVAADAQPIKEGSSIAPGVGIWPGGRHAAYVSQRGAMNAGGNLHIMIRPGLTRSKPSKAGGAINEKIISSRYFGSTKVRELARYLYRGDGRHIRVPEC